MGWLREVPAHWEVLPLAAVSKRKSITGHPHLQLLSVFLDRGVIPFREETQKRTNVTSLDLSRYQVVDSGDFVLNNQQAWRGSVGVSEHSGIVSPAYIVLSLDDRVDSGFANWLLRSPMMVDQYVTASRGVGTIQRNLYWPQAKRSQLPLPPLDEQVAIARFLGWADGRVNQLIEAREKQVGMLEELKASTISEAVTGQIDVRTGRPYSAYKPSGVQWLGRIPAHWELVPNKAVLKRRKVLVGDKYAEVTLLSLTKRGVIVRDVSTGRGKFSADMSTFQEVRSGDLVFCLFDVPETPRTVGLSRLEGMITGAYTIFECKDPLLARFLEAFYIAMDDRKLLSPLYSGLRNTIPPPSFLSIKTAVPPPVEQTAIVKYLNRLSSIITTAVANTRREIALLEEYRIRLIALVVTGKLDVRGAVDLLEETAA